MANPLAGSHYSYYDLPLQLAGRNYSNYESSLQLREGIIVAMKTYCNGGERIIEPLQIDRLKVEISDTKKKNDWPNLAPGIVASTP